MRLLIVIVNYRTASLTIDCLRSLVDEMSLVGDSHVVVVDNASGDGSPAAIAEAISSNGWTAWAQLLRAERNGGFSYGNNAAIRPALASAHAPKFILLLNSDTIVRPGAIKSLVEFMEAHPKVGIAGSRLEDRDGTPQRSAFRFHSVLSELESGVRLGIVSRLLNQRIVAPPPPDATCRTDWVSGASMMVRKNVFNQIGLMDEGYFMYFEEVDFCLRAHRAGWECWYVPASRVVHLVGQSSGVNDGKQIHKRRPTYWFASRKRFFTKNFGPARAFVASVLWAVGFATYRVRRIVQRKPDRDPAHLLWDFLMNSFAHSLSPVLRGEGRVRGRITSGTTRATAPHPGSTELAEVSPLP